MKISIESKNKIDKIFLINLEGQKIFFDLDTYFSIPEGWYELNLPYTGTQNDIKDIKINDETIKWTIYTAYYIDGHGSIHQPATSIWDEGGILKIWIHTNLGIYFERIFNDITSGDYGTDLREKYVFTVDRPIKLKYNWPESVTRFFTSGDGPHWWKLGTDFTPYRQLDIDLPPIDKVMQECEKICVHEWHDHKNVLHLKSCSPNNNELPFYDLSKDDVPHLKKLISDIGYKNIIDLSITYMAPKTHLDLHRGDSNYKRKAYPYIRGCKKFYWALTEYKDWYFKLGKSGIIPLDKPCLINTTEHVHSVVNERLGNDRLIFSIYGELPDDK